METTLNEDIQQKAEQLLSQNDIEQGGLVLLDIMSRDVLAMVSKPSINKENPYENGAMKNQMLTAHFPGSVFKTVVAAAAIEEGIVREGKTFPCNLDLYGENEDPRQLGELTFEESFALSCNRAFALLGHDLMGHDRNSLSDMAERLGLTKYVGWRGDVFRLREFKQFPEEERGKVWGDDYDRNSERAIYQTSIGQKEVKVTPLAVANMMATIADNGVVKQVRGVSRIQYKNGAVMKQFPQQKMNIGSRINSNTAEVLSYLLHLVTETGTARSLSGLEVAGKTGTAELKMSADEEGAMGHHYWFGGFFPVSNPKYAMVVVDLYQTEKTEAHLHVYKDMVQFLYEKEQLN
nr:penicillin-binding transpeptidase domain-containing protein [Salirhabdus salicampi]